MSHLYRSAGGAINFYTGGAFVDNLKKFFLGPTWVPKLNKSLPVGPGLLIVAALIVALVIFLIVRASKKEGFGQFIPGGQTASGFAGTFTEHSRVQSFPNNRTADDQLQDQQMGHDAGSVATGGAPEGFVDGSDLAKEFEHFGLGADGFANVEEVPAGQSAIMIPPAGAAGPSPRRVGPARDEFADCDQYGTTRNWTACRYKKKEGFGQQAQKLPEVNMGFIHILHEDDYEEGGKDPSHPGQGQQVGFLNDRTMGQSVQPQAQRLVEGFEGSYGELKGLIDPETFQSCEGPGGMPLTALQKKVLGCEQEGMSVAPTSYGYAMFPSSHKRRNMLSGQPDKKARQVIRNYCKNQAKHPCKRDPLCNWNANSKSCMPARRPYNECVFPVNPKYKPVDSKTGLKRIIPANSCIDEIGSNFNKWVETDWVLKYDKPYSTMKQSDLYYKQLQNVVHHNPKRWEVKKPKNTEVSMQPGTVQEYVAKRQDPVGVDDTKLVYGEKTNSPKNVGLHKAKGKKEGFLDWLFN